MRNLFFLVVLIAVTSAVKSDKAWEEWKTTYGKNYATDVEDAHRMKIWLETTHSVKTHNDEYAKGLHTFTKKVGKFADLTTEEFRDTYFRSMPSISTDLPVSESGVHENTVESIDWRNNQGNFVTPVKNQAQCGSCWAFSATASLESRCAIKHGANSLESLSAQQIVSCDNVDGNLGCNGGFPERALEWLSENGGSTTEADYPYVSGDGYVPPCQNGHVAYSTPSRTLAVPKSEADLMAAVSEGPVVVRINVTEKWDYWSDYDSGIIFYDSSCVMDQRNHAVVVVGYGSNSQGDYWIVKNSWGADWGVDGYIWMSRNRNNNCGIASEAYYPDCA